MTEDLHICSKNRKPTVLVGEKYVVSCDVCGRTTKVYDTSEDAISSWVDSIDNYPVYYKVAKEFTDTPGHRYGPMSGAILRLILRYLSDRVRDTDKHILLDMDDSYGYPIGFLEEAFGGYVRVYKDNPLKYFEFISTDDPRLPGVISSLVEDVLSLYQ